MSVWRALLGRVDSEQGEAECMGHMTHHIATRNPLSPQPRDSHVLLTAIQRRLELLESAGFWVDRWLKPSRPSGCDRSDVTP